MICSPWGSSPTSRWASPAWRVLARAGHAVIVAEAAMATVRVVKRKWDGSVSAVDTAQSLAAPSDISAWSVLAR